MRTKTLPTSKENLLTLIAIASESLKLIQGNQHYLTLNYDPDLTVADAVQALALLNYEVEES